MSSGMYTAGTESNTAKLSLMSRTVTTTKDVVLSLGTPESVACTLKTYLEITSASESPMIDSCPVRVSI